MRVEDYSEYAYGNMRSPDGIANSIILTRQHPGYEFLSFLIVEGDTDRTFYKTFVDKDKCQINSVGNKSTALQVLSILENEEIPGVLVIVDADFDVLDGKLLASQNVLLTDTHDLETMIIKSPALEKVLGELGSEEKIARITRDNGKDIRAILLACSIPIGYLRWISLREGLSLKFEGLNFSKFIDAMILTINPPELIRAVKNNSQGLNITDPQFKASLQALKNDAHDYWYVCCGHDLVHILSIGLHKAIGTHNNNDCKPEIIERSLRLAFERSHFRKTQLYTSIQQWEQLNRPFVILAAE